MQVPARSQSVPYTLGIDLGSSSIGWALVHLDSSGKPAALVKAGVRIFDPGVAGTDLDIQQGKDGSKAADRRKARLQRRQLRRRSARRRDFFELLQENALLPPYPQSMPSVAPHRLNALKSAARHEILSELDARLYAKWRQQMHDAQLPAADHVLPYFLRASALRAGLAPYEFGRALYHLIQRRGFKSNRQETSKNRDDEEKKGEVYAGIDELSRAKSSQTLGQFFAHLDPTDRNV